MGDAMMVRPTGQSPGSPTYGTLQTATTGGAIAISTIATRANKGTEASIGPVRGVDEKTKKKSRQAQRQSIDGTRSFDSFTVFFSFSVFYTTHLTGDWRKVMRIRRRQAARIIIDGGAK